MKGSRPLHRFLCRPCPGRAKNFSSAPLPPPAATPPSFLQKPSFFKELEPNNGNVDQLVTTLCRRSEFGTAVDVLFRRRGHTSDALSILDFVKVAHLSQLRARALYNALFRLCLGHSAVDDARRVCSHATASGFVPDTIMSNRLMNLLVSSGSLVEAKALFDQMPLRDSCSWNTLISGYSRNGKIEEAQRLFNEMPSDEKDGFSWSSMMSGYVRHGRPVEALSLFREMQLKGSLGSTKFILSAALAASTAISCLRLGKEIHGHILRTKLDGDIVVWSTLSDLYAKCGNIDEARLIFDNLLDRDVVCWTAMMGWYFNAGRVEDGFALFRDMLRSEVCANEFTYAGLLNSCSHQTMEELGQQIHGHMVRTGLCSCSFGGAALIDMYSKCGNAEDAENVFNTMEKPDLVSWSSLISCHAQNGQPELALWYFELMLNSGIRPDDVSFVGVLSACTHAGLVDKGLEIFNSIERLYGLTHTIDHYACVVDLLSRSGRFVQVEEIMKKMPMRPDKFLWASLLNGCTLYGNLRLARHAAEALFEIEPENPATYVTLANTYAKAGMWNDVTRIRRLMSGRCVEKKPGSSWIEVNREVHQFLVGDYAHPRAKEIYLQLEMLNRKMKDEGYVAETSFVLHDVEEEQKEQILVYHSEKLAVAFGIIATPKHKLIKIFKNLRICGDCHTVMKFISRIMFREIIIRDCSRFHHFKNGKCTCRDYW